MLGDKYENLEEDRDYDGIAQIAEPEVILPESAPLIGSTRISYWNAIKKITKVSAPYAGAQLLVMLGDYASVYILGSSGHDQLAASGLVSSVQAVFNTVNNSLIAVAILSGEEQGRARRDRTDNTAVGLVYRQGMILGAIISVPLMGLTFALKPILLGLNQANAISEITEAFFNAKAFGIPFNAGLMVNQQLLLGLTHSKTATLTIISNALVQNLLGYILVDGKLGLPALQERGLGYAMASSVTLHFLATTLYLLMKNDFQSYALFKFHFRNGLEKLRDLIVNGAFISLQIAIEVLGISGASLMAGAMRQESLVIQQSVIPYYWIAIVPSLAASEAIGGLLASENQSDPQNIWVLGNSALLLGLATSCILSGTFLGFGKQLGLLLLEDADYDDERLIPVMVNLFQIMGISLLVDGNRNILIGLLRSLRCNLYPSLAATLSTGVGLGLGYALETAPVSRLGVLGDYIGRGIGIALSTSALLSYWYHKTTAPLPVARLANQQQNIEVVPKTSWSDYLKKPFGFFGRNQSNRLLASNTGLLADEDYRSDFENSSSLNG